MALVLDTSVAFGAADATEPDHEACAELLSGGTEAVVIPSPVLPELDYLVGSRLDPSAMDEVIRSIESGSLRVEDLHRSDYPRVRELMTTYSDAPVGFVDAAVLAIVERLGEPKLATLDRRHFTLMRPRHVESLQLLPAP